MLCPVEQVNQQVVGKAGDVSHILDPVAPWGARIENVTEVKMIPIGSAHCAMVVERNHRTALSNAVPLQGGFKVTPSP